MTVCLFIGPTLRREDVALDGDVAFLPPAAQGDVLAAAGRRPAAIGIVDGYFSGAPSVWHKEILWALTEGVPVFGSASMGALRAAELHGFGMQGVGRIFEGYRDGLIEDDDEVAVQHGPAELGYPPLSEAMVNIRATLARAEAEGVIDTAAREALEQAAKALHFPERRWPALIARLGEWAPENARALDAWLPEGRVDAKREDALEMVAAIAALLGRAPGDEGDRAAGPGFRFEWTAFWDALVARQAAEAPAPDDQAVLDELRLEGAEAVERVRARALLRRLAARGEHGADRAGAEAALLRLREAHGLHTRASLDAWLAENALDARTLERLLWDEARTDALARSPDAGLEAAMLDALRLSGDYPRLARRAREKAAPGAGARPGPGALELRLWHFERRLGRPMPADVEGYARALGFPGIADFDDALRREYVYLSGKVRAPDD